MNCRKIPFFVRGKARRITSVFAERGGKDHVETLYDAKAHLRRITPRRYVSS